MDFTFIADGIDAVIVDNFYTEEQLAEITMELKWLTKPSIMVNEKKLAAAHDNGKILTSKSGVFLEEVFKNWRHSAIITSALTQMDKPEFKEKLLEYNTMFKSLFQCNSRSHLVSYYENADYYKPHQDAFFFTVLNYFNSEPKQFTGGEIVLKSCTSTREATIEPMNNRIVIILSSTVHEVKEIKSSVETLSGNGRYCASIFITYNNTIQREHNDSN